MTAPRLPAAYSYAALPSASWAITDADNSFLEVSSRGVARWDTTAAETWRALLVALDPRFGVDRAWPSPGGFTPEILAEAKRVASARGYGSASQMSASQIDRETWRGLLWLAWRDGMASGGAGMGTATAGVWLPERLTFPAVGDRITAPPAANTAERTQLTPRATTTETRPPPSTTPPPRGNGTTGNTGNTGTTGTGTTTAPPLVHPQTASMAGTLIPLALVGVAVMAIAYANRGGVRTITAREALGLGTNSKSARRSKGRR